MFKKIKSLLKITPSGEGKPSVIFDAETEISCQDQTNNLEDTINRLEYAVQNGNKGALSMLFKLYQLKTDDPKTFERAKKHKLDLSTEEGVFWSADTSLVKQISQSMSYLKAARSKEEIEEGQEIKRVYCPIFGSNGFESRRTRIFSTCHKAVLSPTKMLEEAAQMLCSRSSPYQNLTLGVPIATALLRMYVLLSNKNRTEGAYSFYEIGQGYYGEKFENRDLSKALFWLNEAKGYHYYETLPQQNIIAAIADLDERYLSPEYHEFNMDFLEQLRDMDRKRPDEAWWAKRTLVEFIMSGYSKGEHNDRSQAMNIYKRMYEHRQNEEEIPIFHGLGILAIRTFLGIDTDISHPEAEKILQNLPTHDQNKPVCYACEKQFSECSELIEKCKNDPETRKTVDVITGLIRNVYYNKISFEDAEQFLSSNIVYDVQIACDAFKLVRYIAAQESWITSKEWRSLSLVAETKLLGLTPDHVKKSALSVGPRYNPVSKNGLPVLGQWESASRDPAEVERQFITEGAFVPESGIIRFEGLSAEQNGSIRFKVKVSSEKPALILQEDIDVLMVLAFGREGGNNEAIWPSLGLEPMDKLHKDFGEKFDTKTGLLKEKVFEPHWLGYTNLGKTLFYTDYLIGALTWESKEFQIADDKQSIYPGFDVFAASLLYDFRMTGGPKPDAFEASRIMLRPEASIFIPQSITEDPRTKSKTIHITCDSIPMRVDGSYWKGDDRSIALNDTDFQQGRLTQKITGHYNDIAMMMPVFERARQLVGMQYALFKLRELGYKPSMLDQQSLSERLKHYESLPVLPLNQRIMTYVPF